MSANGIGEYLRARRELVRPDEVGIPDSGRRRVGGLRRDELALLADISIARDIDADTDEPAR